MLGDKSLSQGVDIRCLACGGELYFLPDSYPLVFRCREAHLFLLEDLLNHTYPAKGQDGQWAPTLATLEFWKDRARLFRELTARALRGGQAFAAADFQEAGYRIDDWASKLATLISQAGRQGAPD